MGQITLQELKELHTGRRHRTAAPFPSGSGSYARASLPARTSSSASTSS